MSQPREPLRKVETDSEDADVRMRAKEESHRAARRQVATNSYAPSRDTPAWCMGWRSAPTANASSQLPGDDRSVREGGTRTQANTSSSALESTQTSVRSVAFTPDGKCVAGAE